MGGGRGRGMGWKTGPFPSSQPGGTEPSSPPSAQEELNYLKQQASILRQQMENISKRIEELEKKKR